MKNKRSIYTIAIIFTCAILSSCSDWLDVNHNPNSAEKVIFIQLCSSELGW
jgi:hypothetical protein